ncbi:tetracycline resistance ribosomal protection protein [Paenibacillus oralis]|uniref:Tetracycline resistance ribosomal protection protein n=1 Tax=Paenibacillus oralis TaxID=2490856 RepID=A0A3P3UC92_9BACL|nr:tetracycline resistance ribosomal protection protein [Paenibacillus oralis]RRJ67296.1 tetracycline resistance ribosomal protection protein [Paenibacillus oralis]
MKVINIGILAHVDAGKTTLTESMLYTSGTITEPGRVDDGSTITDSMLLEKQRGITIQASIASFQWKDTKINLIDTPGHIDFFAEVERSLGILDGAILLISAKDGIQSQTRILFEAIKKIKIPTLIYINKIDQPGVNLESLYQDIREKLTPNIFVMQKVSMEKALSVKGIDMSSGEYKDMIIEANETLLEKYMLDQPISTEELHISRKQNVNNCNLFPVYHGSALKNIGTRELMDAFLLEFNPYISQITSKLSALVYKVERDDQLNKRTYIRIYEGSIKVRNAVMLEGRSEKIKIKKLLAPQNGKIVEVEQVESGDIAILPNESNLKIGDIIGSIPGKNLFFHNTHQMMQANISPISPEDRTSFLEALSELSETDPLLQYKLDSQTDIIVTFMGKIQMEVIIALLQNRYHLPTKLENITTIYKERPLKKAEYTVHMQVAPNPFWASIGLSIEPLPIGSGLCYESKVSYGYLNKSFQNAVEEGIKYGCEQGLFGWEVTDLKVCFEYCLYNPLSTPVDFRQLAPIVFEQALKKSGTELLQPCLSFELYVPQDCNSRVYSDLKKLWATIESLKTQHNEIIVTGKIPARTAQYYREQLTEFTEGRGVFLTEPAGYQLNDGEPVYQARKPNARLDKTRHLFEKFQEQKDG